MISYTTLDRINVFLGQISLNFDLKNMISTYTQDNGPNLPNLEENNSKSLDFYDKFE